MHRLEAYAVLSISQDYATESATSGRVWGGTAIQASPLQLFR
jgi:hypothetical protein